MFSYSREFNFETYAGRRTSCKFQQKKMQTCNWIDPGVVDSGFQEGIADGIAGVLEEE